MTDLDSLFNRTLESDKSGLQVDIFHFDILSILQFQFKYRYFRFFLKKSSFLQVAIHAIGDKANDILLDMVDKVVDLNGAKDRRFRVCSIATSELFLSLGLCLVFICLSWNRLTLFSRI